MFRVAHRIGKTPIVVNDSRGFFTSRVMCRFIDEAVAMAGEGLPPASVEQAGSQAGHPTPPLQLLDELTLTLPRRIREETKAAVPAETGQWHPRGSEPVVDRMIDEFDGFAVRARELAERYGERFGPPASLVTMAQEGERYG